jgi:RNA polymerase sigma factor (sigma-70 family)
VGKTAVLWLFLNGEHSQTKAPAMDEQSATELVTAMYDEFYAPLVRYAGRTLDAGLAEDIVQETLMRLYRVLRQGQRVENPKAWAFAVVHREILKTRRQNARLCQELHTLEAIPAPAAGPLAEEANEVSRLFSVLTQREEEVLVLRMSALKYREIGKQLGISIKSVGTMLARALRKLQAANEKRPEEHIRNDLERKRPDTLRRRNLAGTPRW